MPITLAANEADYPAFDLTPEATGDLPYNEGWLIGYRSFEKRETRPLFALGAGRGYARFAWSDLACDGDAKSGVTIRATITNTSDRHGKEVVQVYVTFAGEAHGAPMLKAFSALHLDGGATQAAELRLSKRDFQFWDETAGAWAHPAGQITVSVGRALNDTAHSFTLNA